MDPRFNSYLPSPLCALAPLRETTCWKKGRATAQSSQSHQGSTFQLLLAFSPLRLGAVARNNVLEEGARYGAKLAKSSRVHVSTPTCLLPVAPWRRREKQRVERRGAPRRRARKVGMDPRFNSHLSSPLCALAPLRETTCWKKGRATARSSQSRQESRFQLPLIFYPLRLGAVARNRTDSESQAIPRNTSTCGFPQAQEEAWCYNR
ncbi:hypothetical protein VN12_02400 [Pirellula sp. SH-Sr6A]|nr:hypothetical protein VN12_02400 [Pirellula sp. SH-Sr6A]